MSGGREQLERNLRDLEAELARMRETVNIHVSGELQEWRRQVEKRELPYPYLSGVDRRWSCPSMTSAWQERELERRRLELHRKYEPGIERLDRKIARLKAMLGHPPAAPEDLQDDSPHPTVLALADRAARGLPDALRAVLPGWLERHRAELNAVVRRSLGTRLQIVELFAGIGGLGSGLEAALAAVSILQAERVPERRSVLNARFPLAHQVEDVHALLHMPRPVPRDQLVVAGGFPCRGASRANIHGVTGMANDQTGLWSVMAGVIRAWSPVLVVTENVVSLRSRGLSTVLRDLANADYDVLWGRLDASDFGAPHERARLFCIGIRRGSAPFTLQPRPFRPDWLPWASDIPANDHRAPGKRARVAALGDSVVPIVAYTVGLTAARLLGGWRPDPASLTSASIDDLPTNGWLARGRLFALSESPFQPSARVEGQRWCIWDERFESPGTPLESCIYPPGIGRIAWWDGESDNVDVEMPGGEIMPVPPEWVHHGPWPTAVACDAKNLGGPGQYRRNAPGLNALVQTDAWIAEDGMYCAELLGLVFGGRGIGPSFLEWVLGFPPGWTAIMGEAIAESKPAKASRRAA